MTMKPHAQTVQRRGWCALIALAIPLVAGLAGAADGSRIVRHSGHITSIDLQAGRMTLEEVGPWRGTSEAAQTTRVAIAVTPSTEATLALRAPEPAGDSFPGTWVEVPLELSSLAVGDYVTVECEARGRLTALRVTVALEE